VANCPLLSFGSVEIVPRGTSLGNCDFDRDAWDAHVLHSRDRLVELTLSWVEAAKAAAVRELLELPDEVFGGRSDAEHALELLNPGGKGSADELVSERRRQVTRRLDANRPQV
jgi:hypothetical protein